MQGMTTSGVSPSEVVREPSGNVRLARRDEEASRQYLTETQRCQTGSPGRSTESFCPLRQAASAIWALMVKDLHLHGSAGVTGVGAVVVLCAIATNVLRSGNGPRLTLGLNLNLFLTLLWSDWLVTRERSKHTFAWLRACPIDDRSVAASKFLIGATAATVLWLVLSGLFARELWHPVSAGVVGLGAVIVFGALSIATKWRLSWRIGQILSLLIVLVPTLVFMTIAGEDSPIRTTVMALSQRPSGHVLVANRCSDSRTRLRLPNKPSPPARNRNWFSSSLSSLRESRRHCSSSEVTVSVTMRECPITVIRAIIPDEASRLAAVRLSYKYPICSLVSPCQIERRATDLCHGSLL